MRVAEIIKEDWPIVLQLEFQNFLLLFKSFINPNIKEFNFVCIATYVPLSVMNLCSHDLLVTSFMYYYYNALNSRWFNLHSTWFLDGKHQLINFVV